MKKLIFRLSSGIALFLALFLFNSADVHAEGTRTINGKTYPYLNIDPDSISTWDVYIDENKNVCVETYDLKKTSSISYATLGLTASRCAPNLKALINGVNSESIAIPLFEDLNTVEDVVLANGKLYEHNIFRMPLEKIKQMVHNAGYSEWEQEIDRGFYGDDSADVIFIRFDSIMTTALNGVNQDYVIIDEQTGRISSYINGDTEIYMNRPIDNGANPEAIINRYKWKDPSKLQFHYNRYLSRYGEDEVEAENFTAPKALYETKNYSSKYDISKAIPGGEIVTNAISAATFTGNELPIAKNTVQKIYNVIYNVVMTYPVVTTTTTTTPVDTGGHWVFNRIEASVSMSAGSSGSNMVAYLACENFYKNRENEGYRLVYHADTLTVYKYDWVKETEDVVNITTNTTYKTKTQQIQKAYTAELSYQYLAGAPNLYAFDNMEVYNNHWVENARGKRTLVYDKRNTRIPKVKVDMMVFNKHAQFMGLTYATLHSGAATNFKNIDYTPLGSGYHYQFYSDDYTELTKNLTITGANENDWSQMNSAINNAQSGVAKEISNGCWTRNDHIVINDEKKVFKLMDCKQVNGAVIKYGGSVIYDGGTAATTDAQYGYQYNINDINQRLLASRVTSSQHVMIPVNADNTDRPTGCTVTYKSIFYDNDEITLYAGKNFFMGTVDSIYDHVMRDGVLPGHRGGDPADGYPIRVHTPVVSPVRIVDNALNEAMEKTQLVEGVSFNPEAKNQLLLDSSYFIKWDSAHWTSCIYGDVGYENENLDRYVQNKYMRFPFEVQYKNKLYELGEDGYTQWILIDKPEDYETPYDEGVDVSNYESANHWQLTPFYIPCYAKECGTPGNLGYVECKVEARNVVGRDEGSHANSVRVYMNDNNSFYVASASRPVQLSGYIYDFTIVGLGNRHLYTERGQSTRLTIGTMDIGLCADKLEKKSGQYNRFGHDVLRYLKDGSLGTLSARRNFIDSHDNRVAYCLPIRTGSSYIYEGMGALWKGTDMAYTIKTMANLDGLYDSIEITPTLTFITTDGEYLRSDIYDFKMYHYRPQRVDTFVREFNPANTDMTNAQSLWLNWAAFKESYYDKNDKNVAQFGEWAKTSAENENDRRHDNRQSAQTYIFRKTPTYTMNHISIPASLRLLSGEYEQLRRNEYNQFNRETGQNTILTYRGLEGYDIRIDKKVQHSMQQWHSSYEIPEKVLIVDTRDKGREAFDLLDVIDNTIGFSFAKYEDKEPFSDKDGIAKMIINFKIVAYKDGVPYLQYDGSGVDGNNMWVTEGYTEDTPYKPGDVAIVEMDSKSSDWFKPAIQNIN